MTPVSNDSKVLARLIWLVLGSALGAIAVLLIQSSNARKEEAYERKVFAETGDSREPKWREHYLKKVACRSVTLIEQSKDKAFLEILERKDLSAQQFFYATNYFLNGYWDDQYSRCAPADAIYSRVSAAIIKYPHQGNCHPENIGPVSLMPPSDWMAKRLAKCAFQGEPITGTDAIYDLRVQWMQALATQDRHALPWFDQAYRNITYSSAFGRSAASVAIAADPLRALPRVSEELKRALSRAQSRQVEVYSTRGNTMAVSSEDVNALEQLAYALSIAGPDADAYAEPLREMMDLKFALPSSPFGLLAGDLKSLCLIAGQIGGHTNQRAQSKQYCKGKP